MAHPDASRLPSVKANLKLVRRIPTPSATLCAVGLSKPLTNGFRQLLRSAGAAISLEPGPCPTDRHGFQLDASHNSRVSGLVRAGVEMHPIQGLKGVLPGQSPALNTRDRGNSSKRGRQHTCGYPGAAGKVPTDTAIIPGSRPARFGRGSPNASGSGDRKYQRGFGHGQITANSWRGRTDHRKSCASRPLCRGRARGGGHATTRDHPWRQ